MVAVRQVDPARARDAQSAEIIPFLERLDEGRRAVRAALSLRCWLMTEKESRRGFITDLSSTGARVSGTCAPAVGTRLLCKVDFGRHGGPMTCFAEVVRHHKEGPVPEAVLTFLDPPFGFWNEVNRLSVRTHQRATRRAQRERARRAAAVRDVEINSPSGQSAR